MTHISPNLSGRSPDLFRFEISNGSGYAQGWHAHERQPQVLLVRDLQRYVRDNLQDDLNVDLIGYQFHLSRRHLTRLFKAFTDETLVDFTNRTRVETAARLISTTSLSILDISLAVGIDSPSYLARLFKRYLGLAPSELRKSR